MIRVYTFLLSILFFSTACQLKPPVDSMTSVTVGARKTCERVCKDLEMTLTSLVVVANRSACVCGFRRKKRASIHSDQSGGAVAGEVVRIISEENKDDNSEENKLKVKMLKKVF